MALCCRYLPVRNKGCVCMLVVALSKNLRCWFGVKRTGVKAIQDLHHYDMSLDFRCIDAYYYCEVILAYKRIFGNERQKIGASV